MKQLYRYKKEILSLTYSQGWMLTRFQDSLDFLDMVKELRISQLTINFKINLMKLFDNFPKLKNSSLLLHVLKTTKRE